ncbi:M20 metallopeptidase family protein [Agilicoccus flavus]|uniref:M20 metallopeptidase family protein n=1 Tax=Agilicoccus flavus TaxID=2775968 RepID=UPI0027DA4E82|nr:M20 family metallopeptidase [Agilicoccus flavus]
MPVSHDALAIAGDLVELRHDLHAHPEIGLSLPRTQERVLAGLGGLGIETSTGVGLSSVTGVLTGTRPDRPADAPVVLLRADMDALPVHEDSGVPYASRVPGAMHACGHDLHTAMLVGAARILAARRDELPGDVVLMFQPGEEMHDGAALMIAEGVLDAAGRRADAAYGMHLFSSGFPTGRFVARRGPMLAAADGLEVTVIGRGGHGSAPHQALDPVPVACEIVLALQTMVTRRFGPFEPVVVGVGSLHAGEAPTSSPRPRT